MLKAVSCLSVQFIGWERLDQDSVAGRMMRMKKPSRVNGNHAWNANRSIIWQYSVKMSSFPFINSGADNVPSSHRLKDNRQEEQRVSLLRLSLHSCLIYYLIYKENLSIWPKLPSCSRNCIISHSVFFNTTPYSSNFWCFLFDILVILETYSWNQMYIV